MAKYIIELERGETAYKTVNSNGKPMIQLLAPTPYTEPDTEKVRKEAYDKGFDAGRMLNTGKYEKGINDAWEAARKIYNLCVEEREALFPYSNRFNLGSICEAYSVSEAIEKIRQYEQEKEEQIQVGDEVRNIQHGWTAVVSAIDRECMTLMDTNGKLGDGYDMNRFIKTGRHFPEIASVLEKMRESE